jgi:enhancing lycopene biosynthesis protein 2
MKIGILLSGCGVYDGAEIQEAVFSMLAIEEMGAEVLAIGVNADQHHVVNHLTGEEMPETRNMLVEAARIARGAIKDIKDVQPADMDALVIPGGFGSAKNLSKWAFEGPDGAILPEVKLLIVNMINIGKPIVALCVSPVLVAKALEDVKLEPNLTIGSTESDSPYDIQGFQAGIAKTGATTINKAKDEIQIDEAHKIITAPCYMMETDLPTLRKNIYDAINAIKTLV